MVFAYQDIVINLKAYKKNLNVKIDIQNMLNKTKLLNNTFCFCFQIYRFQNYSKKYLMYIFY